MDADRAELDTALRRAGIGEGRVEITQEGDAWVLRPRAFNASQAAGTRLALSRIADAYGNIRMLPGHATARLTDPR
jgi:hypothetical protein